jgi:hypothetical protein
VAVSHPDELWVWDGALSEPPWSWVRVRWLRSPPTLEQFRDPRALICSRVPSNLRAFFGQSTSRASTVIATPGLLGEDRRRVLHRHLAAEFPPA